MMCTLTAPERSSDVNIPAILVSQQNTRLEDTAASAHFIPGILHFAAKYNFGIDIISHLRM